MICVRLIKDGFRCDMCFQKPNYEIMADDRYNELPAFCLHLCKAHAEQLAKNISDALNFEADEAWNGIAGKHAKYWMPLPPEDGE